MDEEKKGVLGFLIEAVADLMSLIYWLVVIGLIGVACYGAFYFGFQCAADVACSDLMSRL